MAPGARLRNRALQHFLRSAAPHSDLDAVLRFERGVERGHVLNGERGVEIETALLARTLQEALGAVAARVEGDCRHGVGGDGGLRQRRAERRASTDPPKPPHFPYSSSLWRRAFSTRPISPPTAHCRSR